MPKLNFDLRPYALAGATLRLSELDAEQAAILRAFPDLSPTRSAAPAASTSSSPVPPAKRSRKMSAAQKAEVSARMKRYWAARRKAKG